MPEKFRFKSIEEIEDLSSLTLKERMRYDESLKVYRDNLAVREFNIREGFEKGLKKGRAEGKEEGLKKGREEGREEGLKKGREEGRAEERVKIACDLKAAGVPIEIIAKTTGMTAEEIKLL